MIFRLLPLISILLIQIEGTLTPMQVPADNKMTETTLISNRDLILTRLNVIRERIENAKLTTTTENLTSSKEEINFSGMSCNFLTTNLKLLETSIDSLQSSISDDKLQAQNFNKTALDYIKKSNETLNDVEVKNLKKFSLKYFEISSNYLNHANELQKLLDEILNDLENLYFEIEVQGCKIDEIATTQSTTSTSKVNSVSNLPPGFSFDGPADFGKILNIALDLISEFLNEAFGGLTWQQLLASMFPNVNVNASAFE